MGCVNTSASSSASHVVDLKAHEAAPSKCIEECRIKQYHYALIQFKSCKCSSDNSTMHEVSETRCSVRCWSNSSLICGGEHSLSVYRTGKSVSLWTLLKRLSFEFTAVSNLREFKVAQNPRNRVFLNFAKVVSDLAYYISTIKNGGHWARFWVIST